MYPYAVAPPHVTVSTVAAITAFLFISFPLSRNERPEGRPSIVLRLDLPTPTRGGAADLLAK